MNARGFWQMNLNRLPLATWNWLGVNEVRSTTLSTAPQEYSATVRDKNHHEMFELSHDGACRMDFTVEDGADLDLLCIKGNNLTTDTDIVVKIGRDASLRLTVLECGKANSSKVYAELAGNNSRLDMYAFYLCGDGETADINYIVKLKGKNTFADMQVKGAIAGNGDKIFRGTLDFAQGAYNAKARENEEVMILSDNARNRSVPLMLSHEDAVDGKHGVSVGRIDENKLFYLASRGLDEKDSQELIIKSAAAPLLDRIVDKTHRDHADEILATVLALVL